MADGALACRRQSIPGKQPPTFPFLSGGTESSGRGSDHLSSAANSPGDLVVQSLRRVRLFAVPWTVPRQVPLSFTTSWSLLRLLSIESVMPSSHLILCRPLLLPPSIFPSIRVFSNELAL